MVRHHAGTVVARADQPAGSAPTGACGDQVGPVHPHPAGPAHPMGPGLDPLAGGHLSRPRRRDADRLPARCRRIRILHRRDRQGDPARAATGLLHPSRDQGRRFHRDRPLRCAVRSTRQPRRPDRHPAALAARSGLGLSRRHAAITALPPLRRRHRRNPQGSNRTGRLPGDRRTRRRARPDRAGRRAHAPVCRRPAPPRTRRAAVAGDQATRWKDRASSPR